jgi:hypothetical protein
MHAFLDWAFNTYRGCYVMGSLLLTLMMALHYLSKTRKWHRGHWLTLMTCLPLVNLIIVSYFVLEFVTVITRRPIIIGQKKKG